MKNSSTSSIKSVVILGTAHPFRGGLANFNQTLARTFSARGVLTRIFTFTTQYPELLFPGTSQYSSEPAPEELDISRELSSINPCTWIRTGLKVRRLKPNVLWVRYWIPVMAPALGTVCRIARWGRKRGDRQGGIRTVALLDNVIPHEHRLGDRALTRYFVGSIDGFVYMSEQVHQELREFDTQKPALFSPHPMFTTYGEPMPRTEACERLGLDPSYKYVLFFGYIRDYKGLDLLYKAWQELKAAHKTDSLRLIVAGEHYGSAERYTQLIEELGIADELILKEHYISDSELCELFSAADLVVQPYKTATQSGVTQVAYYFDVPMVVTDVGGLREIVPDGEVGYVVAPQSEAIASAIDRFFTEEQAEPMRRAIGEYKKRFTWEQMAVRFEELYKRLQEAE